MYVNALSFYPVTICFIVFPGTVWLASSVLSSLVLSVDMGETISSRLRHLNNYWAGCVYCQWLYCLQYAFHFNPTNFILLWPVEGWWWDYKTYKFDKEVTLVVTSFHHSNPSLSTIGRQHNCTGWCHCMFVVKKHNSWHFKIVLIVY
jgi:hypothetical protein